MNRLGKEGFYGWVALGATAVVSAVGAGGMRSFGVFVPSLIREFSWSSRDASVAYMLLMAVMSLSAPLAGLIVGRIGPRLCLTLGNLIGVAGLILLSFQSHLWQLYMGYGLLLGLGSASLGGLLPMTTVANNWFRKKVTLAMAVIVAAGGFGGILIIPVLMRLINTIGWRNTYLVLAGLLLLFAAILPVIFVRNKPEDLGQVPDGAVSAGSETKRTKPRVIQYMAPVDFAVKEALGTSAFWCLAVAVSATFFLMSMVMAHQVAFLEQVGIGSQWASIGLGLVAGGVALGNLFMGILTVRFTLRKVAVMGFALALVGMLLAFLTHNVVLACIYSLLVGVGEGASLVAGMSILSTYFGRTHYPKIQGVLMVFGILGNLGAPVAGAIHDATKSYTLAWILGAMAVAVGVLSFVLIKPPLHPTLKQDGARAGVVR